MSITVYSSVQLDILTLTTLLQNSKRDTITCIIFSALTSHPQNIYLYMLCNYHFHLLCANMRYHFCKWKDEKFKFHYYRIPLHSRPAGECPKEHHSRDTLLFIKLVIFCSWKFPRAVFLLWNRSTGFTVIPKENNLQLNNWDHSALWKIGAKYSPAAGSHSSDGKWGEGLDRGFLILPLHNSILTRV